MTQKQAFRQLSWKFHGKGPSKKRREKRMQVIGPLTATAPFAAAPLIRPPKPLRSLPTRLPRLFRTWSARWTSHRRIARWTTWVHYSTPSR